MRPFHRRAIEFNHRLDGAGDAAVARRLRLDGPTSAATIAAAEHRLGRTLPAALRDWLSVNGTAISASFGDAWNTLALGTGLLDGDEPLTPVAYIDALWGGRPELFETLSPAQIATIDARFLVFGQRNVDDNAHVYLLVDEHGAAHALLLDQDDMDYALDWLARAASPTPPPGEPIDRMVDAQLAAILAAVAENA